MANPLGTKIGSAFVQVGTSFVGFNESLQTGVLGAITASGATLGTAMENLGKELFKKFTIPFGVAAVANVAQFAQLERAIAETLTLFGTAPSIADEAFGAMRDGITEVSRAVGGLEKDLADGLYQTISAGVDKTDAFEFLSVAQMAAVADKTADVTQAVDGLTTGINAFNLESSDAERVSDAFFATVAKGKTTFGELATDIGRVAPLASNAGATLNETLAIIGQLTVGGLKTSESVSFLRAAITGLLRPGEEMNKVFEDIGYASAEAAVPVLGLQGAFQTVVDAAQGSTSKLQELIGTSEGVTAVLGVTGANADKFAGVLRTVEESAGATGAAFALVDGTVSRSFGKMTEAFDRLGNMFGEMASEFAQPVVDLITSVVNGMATAFKTIMPIVKNVGKVFAGFMEILNIPIIKGVATAIGVIAVSLGGMLGILGGILLPLGKVIYLLFQFGSVNKVVGATVGSWGKLLALFHKLGAAVGVFAGKLSSSIPVLGKLSGALSGLGKAMQAPIIGTGLLAVGIAAVVAVIAGGIYVWSKWQDAQRKAWEDNQTFTIGIDRLSESLGIAGQQVTFLSDAFGDAAPSGDSFRAANLALINQLREMDEVLGQAASKDLLLSIGAQLQFEGATPEEAFAAIQRIANQSGIRLGIGLEDFTELGATVEQLFGGIKAEADLLSASMSDMLPDDALNSQNLRDIDNLASGLAESFVQASNLGQLDDWFPQAEGALAGIENAEALNRVMDLTFEGIEKINGEELGISTGKTSDVESFRQQLENIGLVLTDVQKEALETAIALNIPPPRDDFAEQIAASYTDPSLLVKEQLESLAELKSRSGEILQVGSAVIAEHFGEIEAQITAQLPLLDIYEGAIEQSFSKWKQGQIDFREDLAAITEVRERVRDELGTNMLAEFDAAPIDKQAWLAKLGDKQLDEALSQMALTRDAGIAATVDRVDQDTGEILSDIQIAMNEKYVELYGEAAAAGEEVANRWNTDFKTQAADWVVSAETVMDQVAGIVGGTISGPTVGPLQFGGVIGNSSPDFDASRPSTTNEIHLSIHNATTNNLVGDTNRAVGILRTSRLTGHLE